MYCIVYEPGRASGRRYDFRPDSRIRVGRDRNNDIVVGTKDVSRTHCYLNWNSRRGCFEVVDVSSRGTFSAQGMRLPRGRAYPLNNGQEIRLGNAGTRIRLFSQEAAAAVRQPVRQQPAGRNAGYKAGTSAPALAAGWFKFLIYFWLFAQAGMSVIHASLLFAGEWRIGPLSDMYPVGWFRTFYSGLTLLCIFCGLWELGTAALAIVARFRLASFRKDGPLWLYGMHGMQIMGGLVWMISATLIVRVGGVLNAVDFLGLLCAASMWIFNYFYFSHRRDWFIY